MENPFMENLEGLLDAPEIKKIPWVNCLRAAQKKYNFSEAWFVEELQKAEKEKKK